MQFWQLGESHYWGHNAIIRVEAFTKYCGLSALPGAAPLAPYAYAPARAKGVRLNPGHSNASWDEIREVIYEGR